MLNHQQQKILFITSFIGLSIIYYSKYRCNHKDFRDPLTYGNKWCSICDGWSISHFLLFCILGYYFPKEFKFTMILGIFWEMLEWIISHTNSKNFIILDKLRGISTCKLTTDDTINEHWFYAKYTDLLMNMSGFIVGSKLMHR